MDSRGAQGLSGGSEALWEGLESYQGNGPNSHRRPDQDSLAEVLPQNRAWKGLPGTGARVTQPIETSRTVRPVDTDERDSRSG